MPRIILPICVLLCLGCSQGSSEDYSQPENLREEQDLRVWQASPNGSVFSPKIRIPKSNTSITLLITEERAIYLLFTKPPPKEAWMLDSEGGQHWEDEKARRAIKLPVVVWPFPYIEKGTGREILFLSDASDSLRPYQIFRSAREEDANWLIDRMSAPSHTRVLINFHSYWYGEQTYADFDFAAMKSSMEKWLTAIRY